MLISKGDAMIKIRLREIAEKQGLTQAKIAEMASVSPNTIRTYFYNQVQRPDLELLNKLCKVLGVSLYELLEYAPDPELKAGAA